MSSEALIIADEPEANFWKDEGGRSNKLRMVVRHPLGSDLAVDVPLAFELYYESGRVVEARDQNILNLCKPDYDPWTIPAGVGEAEIEFRLEKVSRRKDGQRFRVAVRPADPPKGADAAAFAAEGAFSRAICVMSKRRTGERVVSRRAPARAAASSSYGSGGEDIDQLHSMLSHMLPTLDETKDSTERVFQTVIAMASRLSAIETAVAGLVASNAGQHQQLAHAAAYSVAADAALAASGRAAQLRHMPSTLSLAPQMSAAAVGSAGMHVTVSSGTAGYAPMQPVAYGQQAYAQTPHSFSRPLPAGVSGQVPPMAPQVSGPLPAANSQMAPGLAGLPPPLPAQITSGSAGSNSDTMAPVPTTRFSARRAAQVKRDRSGDALLAPSAMAGGLPSQPKLAATMEDEEDDFTPKRHTRQSASASSAAAAAAAAEQADDDELDPSALMTAASARAFNPGQQQAGTGMARLPSIASGVIDRLTSREFDGLDVLSSAASSHSKRQK